MINYKRRDVLHISQYDARNITKISAAITQLTDSGITPSIPDIINLTGMSRKVIYQTLMVQMRTEMIPKELLE